jgi:tetratricopeptide (TPR) repeat protein
MVLTRLVGEGDSVGRLVFIDAARATAHDAAAWCALMRRLNERRNSIARDLGGPLTLILPPALDVDFARLAPDLWSIRSVAVELRERDAPMPLLQAFDFAAGMVEDEATLQHEIEQLRERAAAGSEPAMRSLRVLLVRLAGAKRRTGDIGEAERLIDEAMGLAERLGDRGERAGCQIARAELAKGRGDYDLALQLLDEAQAVLRELQDAWALAAAVGHRADILQARGELDEALRIRMDEQLPVYERLGDVRSRAVTMGKVADILQARGELDEALRIRREAELPVYERLGDVRERAVTMGKIADILQLRGEIEEALRILSEEALPSARKIGDVDLIASLLFLCAKSRLARDSLQPDEVPALFSELKESFTLFKKLQRLDGIAAVGALFGQVLAAAERWDEALSVLDETATAYDRRDQTDLAAQIRALQDRIRAESD